MLKKTYASLTSIIVWDLPTRFFHWFLAIGFAIAWITSEDSRYLYAHVYGGYLFFGLLLFRFVWGAVGSHYSRFRAFAYDWPSVWAYLKGLMTGQAARHIGHNPAGGWAIFIILAMGLVVSVSGLLVLGGEEHHGPLKGLVSMEIGLAAKEIHEGVAEFMLALVFIHIAGVIVESLLHKENLIWSMITGRKSAEPGTPGVNLHALLGISMFAVITISALLYFRGYLIETADDPYLPFRGPALADNETWRTECGDCHLAYHPSLLPARSWKLMMEQQADHFGEDLFLEADTVQEITEFMMQNAAEAEATEPAYMINRSVKADQAPLRITETRYWKKEHRHIDDQYWKTEKVRDKINCGACHFDAEQGTFEDSSMRLPDLNKR